MATRLKARLPSTCSTHGALCRCCGLRAPLPMLIGVPVTTPCCLFLFIFYWFAFYFLVFSVLSFCVGQLAEAGTTSNTRLSDLHHRRFFACCFLKV